jgi:bacterioferritin
MVTSPEVLVALNQDLALEHGAIFQYVIHSVQLRDTAIADAVKRVAREEMWHLEWLAEAIRDRGGEPTLDRAPLFLSASLGESLRTDVATEGDALSHYERTLEILGESDADLTALIERIMDDERHHAAVFARLADGVDTDGEQAYEATPRIQPSDFGVIGPTMATEYAGILQYLWNKYGCGDCEQGEQYFDLAIDEMRHAGWAASYVAGMGVPQAAEVPADKVAFVRSAAQARERALVFEQQAEMFYAAKSPEAENPDLRSDLERATTQHAFHRRVLEGMSATD